MNSVRAKKRSELRSNYGRLVDALVFGKLPNQYCKLFYLEEYGGILELTAFHQHVIA